jgi:hypothetical protein
MGTEKGHIIMYIVRERVWQVKGSFHMRIQANEEYMDHNSIYKIDLNDINRKEDVIEENLICFQDKVASDEHVISQKTQIAEGKFEVDQELNDKFNGK